MTTAERPLLCWRTLTVVLALVAAAATHARAADSRSPLRTPSVDDRLSAGGSSYQKLRASLAEIEKGGKLPDVLTCLVNEAAQHSERAAVFIIKDGTAIGWYGSGFERPDAVKNLSISLSADTLFRKASSSRAVVLGRVSQSPETAQMLSRLGGQPRGMLVAPLVLRNEVRAILYCDTPADEVSAERAAALQILTLFASKTIDLISLVPPAAK